MLTSPATVTDLTDQLLAAATGALLLTAVLLLWRRSVSGGIMLLAVQGGALAGLVLVVAAADGHGALVAVGILLGTVKAGAIPLLLRRTAQRVGAGRESAPLVNPTTGMLLAALLTTVAYLVTRPVPGVESTTLTRAAPVGIAVVLIGFLVLVTHRQAMTQIIGFVMVDNGIGATAVLNSGGLPVVIEVGVLFDVLFVVLILTTLAVWIRDAFGTTELHELNGLKD